MYREASLRRPAGCNSTTAAWHPFSSPRNGGSRLGAFRAWAPGNSQQLVPRQEFPLMAAASGTMQLPQQLQPQQQQQHVHISLGLAVLSQPTVQLAIRRVPGGSRMCAARRSAAESTSTASAKWMEAAGKTGGAAACEAAAASTSTESALVENPAQHGQQGKGPGGPNFGLDPKVWGALCLLSVAMLKGSYNPMIRLLYAQDGPPGPVAIMLFRGVLQSIVLVAAYLLVGRMSKADDSEAEAGSTSAAAEAITAEPSNIDRKDSSSGLVPGWVQRVSSRLPFTVIAATELGLWLFLATAIQTLGLQLTTATRAGFLIQSTALLTPLLASFTGEKPTRNVWAGCIVALAGCLLIAADASATDADDEALFGLGGDAAILSSAFFFSLAMVRLGTYARRIPAVELAAGKSVVLACVALGTFLFAAATMAASGDPITDLWPGYTNPLSWAVMVYSALGPGALAAFLHAKGQSVVPPAEAGIIFSTMPLWSVIFAFILLGGEPLSEKTLIGGAAVVIAGLIATRKEGEGPPAPEAAVATTQATESTSKGDKQG